MEPLRVFDGRRLRATLFPGRSRRLVVTFDHRLPGRAGFAPDTHSTSFARGGFAQLCIRAAANDWFVNDETEALEAALGPVAAAYERVQALGYSMGGFGALRLARALRLRQAVLVSPQSTPLGDGRYAAEARGWDGALGALAGREAPGLGGLLVLDPFEPLDLGHARAIQALFPRLGLVRLAFGGHPAIRALRAAGAARVVQAEAGAPRARALPIQRAHRAARRLSRGYWERLAARAEARRPALAAEARRRASALPRVPGDSA